MDIRNFRSLELGSKMFVQVGSLQGFGFISQIRDNTPACD